MTWNPFKFHRQKMPKVVYPEQGSDRLKKSMEKFEKTLHDLDEMLKPKNKDCEKDDRRARPIHH